jgi:hypothetical protein
VTVFVLATAFPALLLAVGIFHLLRRGAFSSSHAALLTLLIMAQAGTALSLLSGGATLWLAVGIGAVAASAASFAEREDLRRVILLGGALAAIQICDPSGTVVAAGMMPATFALGAPREFEKAAGFYASVLFLPLCMAGLLLYLSREGYVLSFPGGVGSGHPQSLASRLLLAVATCAVVAPALYPVRRTRVGSALVLVTAAAVFAAIFAAFAGAVREPGTALSAAAPLGALAIGALPAAPGRLRRAYAAACFSLLLSWAAFATVSG